VIVMYCTKSEFKTFITQSSITCFNYKLKWPKDAHHCFTCSNNACHSINCLFLWRGDTACHGKVLSQILKVTRIKSWHQVKQSCISSLPLSKLQILSTIRWWLLLPNSFHFTVHRSYHLKLCRLCYWQHH